MELQIFKSAQFGEIRTIVKDNEPWFAGIDVSNSLGYQNGSRDINRHVDEDDRCKAMISNKETIIINESGLYSLIMGSKLPEAKKFKKWVTSEVLPSIRKNGGYIQEQKNLSDTELLAKALEVAHRINEQKTAQIEEMKPKADSYDKFIERGKNLNLRTTAKELEIAEKNFIQFLIGYKYLYRDARRQLLPYATEKTKGCFVLKEYYNPYNDTTGYQTLVTPAGRDKIYKAYRKVVGC